jgi:hypothetical protein
MLQKNKQKYEPIQCTEKIPDWDNEKKDLLFITCRLSIEII